MLILKMGLNFTEVWIHLIHFNIHVCPINYEQFNAVVFDDRVTSLNLN